jgi:hypothetical protein
MTSLRPLIGRMDRVRLTEVAGRQLAMKKIVIYDNQGRAPLTRSGA